MNTENGAMIYTAQWQEKIGWRLFPQSHIDMPEMQGSHDCLVCRTTVQLSWLDRIRMLVSGKLEVTTKTATANIIGATKTATSTSVRPPAWLDRLNSVMNEPGS